MIQYDVCILLICKTVNPLSMPIQKGMISEERNLALWGNGRTKTWIVRILMKKFDNRRGTYQHTWRLGSKIHRRSKKLKFKKNNRMENQLGNKSEAELPWFGFY